MGKQDERKTLEARETVETVQQKFCSRLSPRHAPGYAGHVKSIRNSLKLDKNLSKIHNVKYVYGNLVGEMASVDKTAIMNVQKMVLCVFLGPPKLMTR